MAHPYAGHKQNAVGKRRVKLLLRTGGYHGDDLVKAAGKLQQKIASHEREERHSGEYAQGGRIDKYARGGRSKSKPHVSINIVHHSRPSAPQTPLPLPGPGLGAPPPGIPPAAGGALPPPGMPGMKRGGRASYKSGVSSPENLKKWKSYASEGTVKYAAGGRTESLVSLPNGGPANKLSPMAKSPGGNSVGVHSGERISGNRRAWADRLGGTERTRQAGKMRSGKHFGSSTGPGNITTAVSQKSSYP